MSTRQARSRRYVGTYIDTPRLGKVRIRYNHAVDVNQEGFISSLHPYDPSDMVDCETVHLPTGSFFLPTFVDLHLHAPQFLYQGTGLHLPLMQWLDTYTYPAEERLDADPGFARLVYNALAKRLVENGTGAVLLFGTIQTETNLILAEAMQTAGIRAFVGKLSMDISSRPTYVEASAAESLSAARDFVYAIRETQAGLPLHERLIHPVLTPRFVPTCSDELLAGLGALSEELDVHLQSHLAEARDQVNWVRETRGQDDIDVFDKHGLLTHRATYAHCTYVTTSHLSRLATSGVGIAHCPLSNAYFSAKPFPLREALSSKVNVGLGTDIAGGYSADLSNSMRQAVVVARMRQGGKIEAAYDLDAHEGETRTLAEVEENVGVNWMEALYLATKGGAETLRLPQGCGSFAVGAPFDAQLIEAYSISEHQTALGTGVIDVFVPPSSEQPITLELLEKWWCIGDPRNRKAMWVQGRQLSGDALHS